MGIGKVPRCRDFADSQCKTIRYAMYNATDDEDTLHALEDIVERVRLGTPRAVRPSVRRRLAADRRPLAEARPATADNGLSEDTIEAMADYADLYNYILAKPNHTELGVLSLPGVCWLPCRVGAEC